MAKKLTINDIQLINDIINQPDMIKLIGMGKDHIDMKPEFYNFDCFISDDGMDLAFFEKKDLRVAQGHNAFRSHGRQAIINGKDIIQTYFEYDPYLNLIFGLTPIQYQTTRRFNALIGMKPVKYEWLESDILAYRYEIYR